MIELKVVPPADGGELIKLRKQSFLLKYGAPFSTDQFRMNSNEPNILNLGLYLNSELTSSFRVKYEPEIVSMKFDLDITDQIWLRQFLGNGPQRVAIGSLLCTRPTFQNKGYGTLLQLWAFKILKSARIDLLLSCLDEKHDLVHQLIELGYLMSTPPNALMNLNSHLKEPKIFKLELKANFETAIGVLEKKLANQQILNSNSLIETAMSRIDFRLAMNDFLKSSEVTLRAE